MTTHNGPHDDCRILNPHAHPDMVMREPAPPSLSSKLVGFLPHASGEELALILEHVDLELAARGFLARPQTLLWAKTLDLIRVLPRPIGSADCSRQQ